MAALPPNSLWNMAYFAAHGVTSLGSLERNITVKNICRFDPKYQGLLNLLSAKRLVDLIRTEQKFSDDDTYVWKL